MERKKSKNKKLSNKKVEEKETQEVLIEPKAENIEQVQEVVKPKKRKKNKKVPINKLTRFNPSYKTGLTSAQVEQRIMEGYSNEVKDKNTKTYGAIFFTNIVTFFNILCFIVAGALIWVGSGLSNIFFMVIVIANMAIGIIQEIKAKKTIEKIKLVTSPIAKVVRDGYLTDISTDKIVLDDIVYFESGKQICADCVVTDGEVEVNESLLTGESIAIKKKKGDKLLSGSFIVGGKCYARVTEVGNETYTSKLSEKAKKYSKPKSELLQSMKIIIRSVGIVIIPLAILMFINNQQSGYNLTQTIEKTAASVIGMIPAGMFLLTSMALAVGVVKLAGKRTLVQDLYSIEMLARTDVLCLDKTGTITDGTMKVSNVIPLDTKVVKQFDDIIGSMLTGLDDNNQTSRALISRFGYSKAYQTEEVLPFTSDRKLSAVTFKNGETYAFGAPEFLMKTRGKELDKLIDNYASKGFRVLLVCKCEGTIQNGKLSQNKTPIALIVIEDHIREDAVETIAWFKENGVTIKIISGDNPLTVSEVSKRVGVDGAEKYINLEGLNEQQIIDAVDNYTVFGRVTPEQKAILVKALKNKGHKVAMTGDGVNDILALKEADCSIAMASGSEATRHVSHLVLLDSNFSSMPSVVAEGRRVVNNVQNSSSLFLMKTIFTILLTLFCLVLSEGYPFEPSQVLILETCVIGIPSFFLALQPNTNKINGSFLTNLLIKSLPAAIIFFLNVLACFVLKRLDIIPASVYPTMASLAVTFTGVLVLLRICKPLDIYRGILFAGVLILITLVLTFAYNIFNYVSLNISDILFIIVFVETSYPVYSTLVKFFDKSLKR